MPLGQLGKYERVDVLGHGVSGIVYLAKDTLLNKQVALKEVDVEAGNLQKFLEEARVLDRLRHPNIVRVNGVDRIDSKVVIDMEFVDGSNLQEKLRAEGRLSLEKSVNYAIQILDALEYAHSQQIVHRDIKPANILVTREGVVKIVDFGLAEILATNAYAGGAGTYAYMAPEDFAEIERSDRQSDVWAVGITLYELLTGYRPFQVERVKDPFAWKRILDTEAPDRLAKHLPRVSPQLQAILDRAIARDKLRRYSRCADFRDDLLRFREGESVSDATLAYQEEDDPTPTIGVLNLQRNTPFTPPAPPVRTAEGTLVAEFLMPELPPVPVVAEKPEEEREAEAIGKRGLFGRKSVPLSITVVPDVADFGAVRKGEMSCLRVKVKITGLKGAVGAQIGEKPDWLTVHPRAFEYAKQTLTLTAHANRIWETGHFEETVTIHSDAGDYNIPLRLQVINPRLGFAEIMKWYAPLLLLSLLPVTAVSMSLMPTSWNRWMLPPVVGASGFMLIMLTLICNGADTVQSAKLIPGLLGGSLVLMLGAMFSSRSSNLFLYGHGLSVGVGCFFLAALMAQMFHIGRWKAWAFALFCIGLGLSSCVIYSLMR